MVESKGNKAPETPLMRDRVERICSIRTAYLFSFRNEYEWQQEKLNCRTRIEMYIAVQYDTP